MLCKKCGNEVPEGKDFCVYCGEPCNTILEITSNEDNEVDSSDMPSLAPTLLDSPIEIDAADRSIEINTTPAMEEASIVQPFDINAAPSSKNVFNDGSNDVVKTFNTVTNDNNQAISEELQGIINKVTSKDMVESTRETLAGDDFNKADLSNERYDEHFRARGFYGTKKDKNFGFIIGIVVLVLLVGVAAVGIWYQRKMESPEVVDIDPTTHGVEDPIEDPVESPDDSEEDSATKKIKELVTNKGYTHSVGDFYEFKGYDVVIPSGLVYKKSDNWLIIGNVYFKSYVTFVGNNYIYISNSKEDIQQQLIDKGYTVDNIIETTYDDAINYLIFSGTYNETAYELIFTSLGDESSVACLSFSLLGSFDETYDMLMRLTNSVSGSGEGLTYFSIYEIDDYKDFFNE